MGIYLSSGLSFVIKRKNTSKNTESAKNRYSEDDENNSDYEESYFSYDVANNLSVFTDSEGRDTTFLYDDFGNLLQQTSPDSGTTSYEYDEAGNLTSRTDAQQKTTGYTYDTENRISVICDFFKYYHNFSRINDHKIFDEIGCFAEFFRSFGEGLICLRRCRISVNSSA